MDEGFLFVYFFIHFFGLTIHENYWTDLLAVFFLINPHFPEKAYNSYNARF